MQGCVDRHQADRDFLHEHFKIDGFLYETLQADRDFLCEHFKMDPSFFRRRNNPMMNVGLSNCYMHRALSWLRHSSMQDTINPLLINRVSWHISEQPKDALLVPQDKIRSTRPEICLVFTKNEHITVTSFNFCKLLGKLLSKQRCSVNIDAPSTEVPLMERPVRLPRSNVWRNHLKA